MSRLLRLAARGAVVLLAGCNSCSSEYTIPDGFEPTSAPTPEDHGVWLSMDVTPDGQRLAVAFYDRTKGALGFATGDIDALDNRRERAILFDACDAHAVLCCAQPKLANLCRI